MSTRHTALSVTDKLIRLSRSGEIPITPMQAQKLTYFCHAWMLGLGHGPLFQDAVEAWQYGPVIRSVYHALKHYGREPITEPLLAEPAPFNSIEDRILTTVWGLYGETDGIELSKICHVEGSPWHQVRGSGPYTQIIPDFLIRDYYADLVKKHQDGLIVSK